MKQFYLLFCFITASATAQNIPTVEWAGHIGGRFTDKPNGIRHDANDNIYVTGSYAAYIDLDWGEDTLTLDGINAQDAFVAKYNSSMELQWHANFPGQMDNSGLDVDIDALGNVYSVGTFSRTVDFDPGPGTFNLTVNPPAPYENIDIYISKLDANGNFLWAQRIAGNLTKLPAGFEVDDNGNIYMVGYYNKPITFESGLTLNTTSTNGHNTFICKIDPAGNLLWAKQIGAGTLTQIPRDLALDSDGNVYVNGQFNHTTDFDPGTGEFVLTPHQEGLNDIYILKLNNNGEFVWVKQIGGTNAIFTYEMALSGSQLNITGSMTQTIDFDPGPSTHYVQGSNSYSKPFLLQLDTNGDFQWVDVLNFNGTGQDVTFNTDGTVVMSGEFHNSSEFTINGNTEVYTSAGSYDIFMAEYSNNGQPQWAKCFGGPEEEYRALFSCDSQGSIFAMGQFRDTAVMNNNIDDVSITSHGGRDIFLLKISDEVLSTHKPMENAFSIYPNPCVNELHFKVPEHFDDAELAIYSMTGQIVKTAKVEQTVDVSSLASGAYILRVTNNNQVYSTKLMVD